VRRQSRRDHLLDEVPVRRIINSRIYEDWKEPSYRIAVLLCDFDNGREGSRIFFDG
jgi:hypothetical protein